MTKSVSWHAIHGVSDAREAARAAARAVGLSLGDWLDEAFHAKARELGIEIDDLTDDEKIACISERLSTVAASRNVPRRRRDDVSPRPRSTRFDILDAAARRLDGDTEEAAQDMARRISEIEDLLIQRAMPKNMPRQNQPPAHQKRRGASDRIDGQLARIAARLRADTSPDVPRTAPQNELTTLRRQVSDLARAVETIADKSMNLINIGLLCI